VASQADRLQVVRLVRRTAVIIRGVRTRTRGMISDQLVVVRQLQERGLLDDARRPP
jgi:hypothetical protein